MSFKIRRFRSMLAAMGLMLALAAGCESSNVRMYDHSPVAPSFAKFSLDELKTHMGATVIDSGINFTVYSEHAERIEILLFDNPESEQPTMRLPLTKHDNNIWSIYVAGVGAGQHYGYVAWGPNWPYKENFTPGSSIGFITDCDEQGNRFNPNKLLIDPYTRRLHRDFDWSRGNPASGTARDVSTWGAAGKSVVIQSKYQWSDNEAQWLANRQKGDAFDGHAANDAIYYEVHPKGFTAKAIDSRVTAPGTWRGIGENAEYLKDLGITAVELMPVAEKPDDGTYWGYNAIAFFAPEQRYAYGKNLEPNAVIDEFKEMVDKLHQAGIEVILDVVYNHTGEGGFWRSRVQSSGFSYGQYANFDDKTAATIYSWRGLDNAAYYHLADKDGGIKNAYRDDTGVGNQTRTNYAPFRQFIMDNLHFWVEEMHIDGFRFDLATILGVSDTEPNGDVNFWFKNIQNTVLQDIIDDEVFRKNHTRMVAEPWHLGIYGIGGFPKSKADTSYAWSEWNGRFRDMIRKFVNQDDYLLSSTDSTPPNWEQNLNLGNLLTGSSNMFGDDGRAPYNSVNFLTAHDGFTLYDLATYWQKQNDCGKLNPICCDQAYNAFCDRDSGENDNASRNWCGKNLNTDQYQQGYLSGSDGKCDDIKQEELKRQIIRTFFALLMVSHGSPMILGGDEYMRTQFGNNNAYSDSADNDYNWFRWGDWISSNDRVRMHDFVRNLIKLRKQFRKHLAPTQYAADANSAPYQWWWPNGISEDRRWQEKSLAMYYPAKDATPSLYVIINMETNDDKEFTLPEPGDWKILADTQSFYDSTDYINADGRDPKKSYNITLDESSAVSDKYNTKPRTVVILSK